MGQPLTIDPRHPVIVGAHELAVRTADAEPIAMMVEASTAALKDVPTDLRSSIGSVRVVKGIWPYRNPGRLIADRLGMVDVTTALTGIGGNATYDLVNQTATDIASGSLDAAIICGAESMRTRRKDKSAGRRSSYLEEPDERSPDLVVSPDVDLVDDVDIAAGIYEPVNFYAMVESVIRHRRGESHDAHLKRISELWARGSEIASHNPHAWFSDAVSADMVAMDNASNRRIASPYTKLLTSNINVDQGAAIVMCAYARAIDAGLGSDQMTFLSAGSGAYDHLTIRERIDLDRSPAFRLAAQRALLLAGYSIDEVDHLDLYSCFPASVQLAQDELGLGDDDDFTITGGLTFAGGPYNGYCTQAIAHAAALLRSTSDTALLYGNGGFFSKHSVVVLSGTAPPRPYRCERVQEDVDRLPSRQLSNTATVGVIEAYTVVFDRRNEPDHAILSVLDQRGTRSWALLNAETRMDRVLSENLVGAQVELEPGTVPIARLS